MKWVTRPRIRLDRSACIWLILRHIDPAAEVLYREPADMVQAFAEGALPFHNTSVEEKELAERTSFEMLIVEYGLASRDRALEALAEIVRGAELTGGDAPPESAGLRAITKGMNSLVKSDEEMAASMLPVFDALYTFCVRRVAGQNGWANSAEEKGG